MRLTRPVPFALVLGAALALAACGAGPAPSDVADTRAQRDAQGFEARQAVLRGDAPAPGTAAPGTLDVAGLAAGAIDAAEGGAVPGAVGAEDDFTPPPLPEGMSVVGAQVMGFALTTSHPVGTEMYRRPFLRLRRPEVSCADFRTTDLVQDWFLRNGGPERDTSNLDPDGDGYACNWDPERYRAQARAAAAEDAAAAAEAETAAAYE